MPADVFPGSAVASVYGLASMGSGFGGMLFTLMTGWAVDHYSYTPVFIGFGIMPLICALILWTLAGPFPAASAASRKSAPRQAPPGCAWSARWNAGPAPGWHKTNAIRRGCVARSPRPAAVVGPHQPRWR